MCEAVVYSNSNVCFVQNLPQEPRRWLCGKAPATQTWPQSVDAQSHINAEHAVCANDSSAAAKGGGGKSRQISRVPEVASQPVGLSQKIRWSHRGRPRIDLH